MVWKIAKKEFLLGLIIKKRDWILTICKCFIYVVLDAGIRRSIKGRF